MSVRTVNKNLAKASLNSKSEDEDDESEHEDEDGESEDESEDEEDEAEDEDEDNESEHDDECSEDQGPASGGAKKMFRALNDCQLVKLMSGYRLLRKLRLEHLGDIIIRRFRYCLKEKYRNRYDKNRACRLLYRLNEVVGAIKDRPAPVGFRLAALEERDWWLVELAKKKAQGEDWRLP